MEVNDKSPDFNTTDENGKEVASKDFRGKTVVLYFYPKADTPGCTKEACGFRDSYSAIKKTGVVLLGISADTAASQKKFQDKFSLPSLCWPIQRRKSPTCSEWSKRRTCTARR